MRQLSDKNRTETGRERDKDESGTEQTCDKNETETGQV